MGNFLTVKYWFNLRPGALAPIGQQIFIIVIVFFISLAFVSTLIKARRHHSIYFKFWQKIYNFCLCNAIIGLFLFFFDYEMLPLLSARFLLLLWLTGIIVWFVFIGRYIVKIPKIKEKVIKEQEFKKYIP